jgi:hypothetical protein
MKPSMGRVHLSTPSIATQRTVVAFTTSIRAWSNHRTLRHLDLQVGKRNTPLCRLPSKRLPFGLKFCRHRLPTSLNEARRQARLDSTHVSAGAGGLCQSTTSFVLSVA